MIKAKLFTIILLCVSFSLAWANTHISLDQVLQNTIDHYLQNEGKGEGVTGISTSVSYTTPKNFNPIIKTYITGLRGYPPFNQPVTMNNLYEIGSITKSFTSMLILQLQAEGKLSIHDRIGRWFPQYPNWKDVTIKQLLEMTSGIPSYTFNPKFIKKIYKNIQTELTTQELLNYAYPEKPLSRQLKFEYSNTNYILAGLIIEAETNKTFNQILQEKLLNQPIPLKNTYYVAGPTWKAVREKTLARMVHGYYYDDKTKKMVDVTNSNLSWAGPAGAMLSDTQDMITWINVLYHGLAIQSAARKKALSDLETTVSMETGKPISEPTANDPKGFGLGVGSYYRNKQQGQFWVYQGSGMGYRMMYLWHPCNNVSVVAVLNSKGGEGNPNFPGGNHIMDLIFKMYDEIVEANPHLNCKD